MSDVQMLALLAAAGCLFAAPLILAAIADLLVGAARAIYSRCIHAWAHHTRPAPDDKEPTP